MGNYITRNNDPINEETRSLISQRYKKITRAVNSEFWNINSENEHTRYVGSYGRGTAINTSDLDVLFQLPQTEYDHFTSLAGNGPSRLLQIVKNAILDAYPRTSITGDGQVVVVNFSDGMKFEVLPAFQHVDYYGRTDGTYVYPDTHMGGNWLSTNPLAEQKAMRQKNAYEESNGLLFDTCKHIRTIKSIYFSNYHLSGILIDTFVYNSIADWHWLRNGEKAGSAPAGTFEKLLMETYSGYKCSSYNNPRLIVPGSGMIIDTSGDWAILGKVLNKMV